MSMTFTKLFSSITESTIWSEDDSTRIVWITMLAMADRNGRVWGSIPGLANRARVEIPQVEAALDKFQKPDKYSRTTEHEGRRIAPIDGGWLLLNHAKYRAVRDEEAAKEKAALRVAKYRASKKGLVTNVTDVTQSNDNAEAYQMQKQSQKHTQNKKPEPASNEAFEEFYKAYPKKKAKKEALKAWLKINPDEFLKLQMQKALEDQKVCEQWTKQNGDFIPYPASWLNGEMWLDEVKVQISKPKPSWQLEAELTEIRQRKQREEVEAMTRGNK